MRLIACICLLAACGGPSQSPTSDGGDQLPPKGTSTPAQLATALRGKSNFLIGLGNDLNANHDQDGAYTLGVTLDLHYAYLVGLQGMGGWTDWNADGAFVDILADAAMRHNTTPMYTLYSMAAWGEGNASVLTNDQYMGAYWSGAKLLFQRLGKLDRPAVVHLEPDFWGFIMQQSKDAKMTVHVKALAPDCAGLTDDLAGMGHCLLKLARQYAPKTLVGFHASSWGGSNADILAFFKAIGADQADFVATDALDRDAGCFEAHTDPNCQRGGTTGWYLDESNATSPNYHEHFAWVKAITDGLKLPMMWWQVPMGVPSNTPGGTAGHYRDNHVHYFFAHIDELIAAGGLGMVFGTGAGNQTFIDSDGGQLKQAATNYLAKPAPLP